MKILRCLTQCQFSVTALLLLSVLGSRGLAQEVHSHAKHSTIADQARANALVQTIRDATERFKDVRVAQQEGYALQFGCVSGENDGAMGLHFVNSALVGSGAIDPEHPQIVLYEPTADGHLQLTGADFLVLADSWNAKHSSPPELMGQLFHFFPTPNRFGLPAFYTLHVWAWKDNPNGAFVNWHPDVSCQLFGPPV